MLDLKSVVVGQIADLPLSLHDFLLGLKRQRQLQGLLLQALAENRVGAAARQAGLAVGDDELQLAANRFRRRHGLTGAEPTRQWLAREGLTVDDFEAALERDLLRAKFARHLTQARVADHFAAHRDDYARAELRQLVVASEGTARELLAQLTDEGADFAELARTHSLDGPSRLVGGSLGEVPRRALPAAAAEAIFVGRAGDVLGPFPTEHGYHLFQVDALRNAELDEETTAVIRQELFDAWLRDQFRDVRLDLSWLESP